MIAAVAASISVASNLEMIGVVFMLTLCRRIEQKARLVLETVFIRPDAVLQLPCCGGALISGDHKLNHADLSHTVLVCLHSKDGFTRCVCIIVRLDATSKQDKVRKSK